MGCFTCFSDVVESDGHTAVEADASLLVPLPDQFFNRKIIGHIEFFGSTPKGRDLCFDELCRVLPVERCALSIYLVKTRFTFNIIGNSTILKIPLNVEVIGNALIDGVTFVAATLVFGMEIHSVQSAKAHAV